MRPLRYRQIHLDFHNSEHIPGVGARFDPDHFVRTLESAHVDSITLFAKCHHGWSYYPTSVGEAHPNLVRPDLLGEMISACARADIETPVYIAVQWDERTARLHPEWRAMPAENTFPNDVPGDHSMGRQLSPAWHSLCLAHAGYRQELLAQAREVARRYPIAGLFMDIVKSFECVCPDCLERMDGTGLEPERFEDRRANDEAVNREFKAELSGALRSEFPDLRVFYNDGHIAKGDRPRYDPYTHLELESLPTGGWGFDHFPLNARYAASLGFQYVGHTGKFHTSWGEFGGFKQPDALVFETAQMVALGARCLVGDQLHPGGAINEDTYRSIAPAYARVEALEPYVRDARAVTEVAIVCAEAPGSEHNHPADDGAAQMLAELGHQFALVDGDADFASYRLLILPDETAVSPEMGDRIQGYIEGGGSVLLSGRSAVSDSPGGFAFDTGVRRGADPIPWDPTYAVVTNAGMDPGLVTTPFVMYGRPEPIVADGAEVFAEVRAPYFNRTYRTFTSHQHAPDDPDTAPIGPAVTQYGRVGYVAYPVFAMYQAMGQPLYKYLIRGLIHRLMPDPLVESTLPSSARVVVTRQEGRHVVHLLYGAPQVRGRRIPDPDHGVRVMEMIEDIPRLGPFTLRLRRLPGVVRVYDAPTGSPLDWIEEGGTVRIEVPDLHIHRAIVVESAAE